MKLLWKNTKQSWGILSITLHWFSAVIIVALFISGLWMHSLTYYHSWYYAAPDLHKIVGILLFFLTVIRLIWRITTTIPKQLPSHTNTEQILARLMHMALYLLLFGIMISGYLISTTNGRPIAIFDLFKIPALPFNFASQADIAHVVHLYLAYLIISMTILHGLAAMKHHFVDKDNTLSRMLGYTRRVISRK